MLSERPDVRVHNDPLRMCPARESGAFESRLPALTAALLGAHFLCRQRKGTKKIFLDSGLHRSDGFAGCRIGGRHNRLVVDVLRGVTLGLMIQIRFWGCRIAG